MKRTILYLYLLGMSSLAMVNALDLMVSGGYGNFLFDSSRTTSLQSENKAFSEQPFILGTVGAQEIVADSTKITVLYERDSILRNILYTSLFYDLGFATIQGGPYFGIFNTTNLQITPGLSMALQIGIPGLVFGTFRSDTTLGTGLQVPGDYVQQKSELGLWIWGSQILTKFIIQSRSFSEQKSTSLIIKDTQTRYLIVADIFKKNVSYQVTTTMGYLTTSRSYITTTTTDTDTVGAIILGLEGTAKISSRIRLVATYEMPLYCWGIGGLKSPPATAFFYQTTVGVVINFDPLHKS
ncbi:MAG: hypothetical protein N2Z76_01605 [Treponemataceae bacterium]|nr:hypothetical protein [Treponemataceae bacterium]